MAVLLEILIVDDEAAIVVLLAELLTDAGYIVRIAANGISALAAVQEHIPALIILDNMMPGLSGLDVVRSLRAEGFISLPIIMMSAATTTQQVLQTGATDFILKPFSLDEVLECVELYIGLPPS